MSFGSLKNVGIENRAALGMAFAMSFGLLFGCGAGPATFEDVVAGRVEIDTADRTALERLIGGSDLEASQVEVLTEGASMTSRPAVRIEGGRVTGLELDHVSDPSGVLELTRLRELRLHGGFASLALSDMDSLETLDIVSDQRQLRNLSLRDLPSLRELRLVSADVESLAFEGVRLERLMLNDCGRVDVSRVPTDSLQEVFLLGTEPSDLRDFERFQSLRHLRLRDAGIETLASLPPLESLKTLSLVDNPLRMDLGIRFARFPELSQIDLRGTGLLTAPQSLSSRSDLRVVLDSPTGTEPEFEEVLQRLREGASNSVERVEALQGTTGRIERRSGQCRWKVSTLRRARVSCRLTLGEVTGSARVELGTTDAALPFQGGGRPRVRARVSVEEGEVALYLPYEQDLIQTARVITNLSEEKAEVFREPADRFKGFRRVVARGGEPAELEGDLSLLGSSVFVVLESVGGSARGVTLEVDPPS